MPNKQRHNHAFPFNKPHYSPSKICITIHAPSQPFLHINHPLQQPIHAHLARTQKRSQTKHFSILCLTPLQSPPGTAITKTLSLPPPPPLTPAGIPNPAHSILKDNSSANRSFASPRRRFHGILDSPGLSRGCC